MGSWRTLLLSFSVFAFAGCSPRLETRGAVLRFETLSLSRTFGSCDSALTPCVSIRFSYPAITPAVRLPGVDSVVAFVHNEMFASLVEAERPQPFDSIASDLIEQYSGLKEEFADYNLPWTLERLCTILRDTAGVISIRFEETSFLGGAHGLRIVRLASFDASSGKRLTYGDLFRPGSDSVFARIAEREFRAARSIPDTQSLTEAGFWIEEGKFEPSQNVAVGKTGLVLYYNPYEVAPYSMGPTEVRIPFALLGGVIRLGGPLEGME